MENWGLVSVFVVLIAALTKLSYFFTTTEEVA